MTTSTPRLRDAWQILRHDKVFWALIALKVLLATCCGSHFATRWFVPFLHDFGAAPFVDPWQRFLERGDVQAFPYGPSMLLGLGAPWLVAANLGVTAHDASSLLLLRLPLLGADVLICLLLMSWLPAHARTVARSWSASPIVIYATYVHGQLDLWPTALLLLALWFVLGERPRLGAFLLGLGLAAKLHLLVALPFILTFLWKRRRGRSALPAVLAILAGTLLLAYAPVWTPAFKLMVLQSPESARLWAVALPFGPDIALYLAPTALLFAWLRMATWRSVERDLCLLMLGLAFLALVALVPPQPGWFVWSAPFVVFLGAQFTRTASWSIRALNLTYLLYFFVAQSDTALEAFEPLLGAGQSARWTAQLQRLVPALADPRAPNLAWTLLFCATTWTAWEMTRRGISARTSARHDEVFLIGIGGDSGAGKHTLGRDLLGVLGDRLALVDGDDDHRWERGDPAWQTLTHLDPRANRLQMQLAALQRLRQGADVRKPRYDHVHGRFTQPKLWPSARVVGLVGLHPFYLSAQRRLLDLRVFVDAAEDVRRAWKMTRDVQDRGKTEAGVLAEMERREPDAQRFVQPQRQHADVVLGHLAATETPHVHLRIEMAGHLDPFALLAALQAEATLQVEWLADPSLHREALIVTGELPAEAVARLAALLLPDADDWLIDNAVWHAGQRGLAQLVLLHALGAAWNGANNSDGVTS
jgi:uridine kinase